MSETDPDFLGGRHLHDLDDLGKHLRRIRSPDGRRLFPASWRPSKQRGEDKFGKGVLDFGAVDTAARRFTNAGAKMLAKQKHPPRDVARLNQTLLATERALLVPQGLPRRPWYRHAIYAPGEYTGYAAVVIPGVNEALDKGDSQRVRQQLAVLAAALERAAKTLDGYR